MKRDKLDVRGFYIIKWLNNHLEKTSFRVLAIVFLLLLTTFTINTSLWAQRKDSVKIKEDKLYIVSSAVLNNVDTLRAVEMDLEKVKITPYIVPAYTPEMELFISLGGLLTFKTQRNPLLNRSSVTISTEFSTAGAFNSSIRMNLIGPNNRFKSTLDFWLKSGPDNYWGVGYDHAYNYSKSDSTTWYTRTWMQLAGKFVYKFYENLYIGINYDFNYMEAREMNPRMELDPYVVEYGTMFSNGGLGLSIDWDTRDYGPNAYTGFLISANSTFYSKSLGGSNNFRSYMLDIRKYITIKRERQTLAFEIKTKTQIGNVSWNDMSIVGSPFDLRGYYWGRYRDKTMLFGLMEYRYMFVRNTLSKRGNYNSRHGFVVWGGLGSIAPKYKDFRHIIPNAGVGYRLEIQPKMNVRADFGFGQKSYAFYLTFQEAF